METRRLFNLVTESFQKQYPRKSDEIFLKFVKQNQIIYLRLELEAAIPQHVFKLLFELPILKNQDFQK